MSLFTAQLYPGQALGFLVLGASLHDILTRLKAEPQRFPKLDVIYSSSEPIKEPVIVNLPSNGVRLRFDGPEQRLRLIEVLDFTKNHITFKEQSNERDLFKPPAPSASTTDPSSATTPPTGPTFKHIYNRFLGPTYDGEFVGGGDGNSSGGGSGGGGGNKDEGTYVLSYPGCAFTFPMSRSAYSPSKDVMSLLSHNGSQVATSMAVFSGDSWAQARETLWTEVLPSVKTFAPLAAKAAAAAAAASESGGGGGGGSGSGNSAGGGGGGSGGVGVGARAETSPDEVSLVRIHGGGNLQLFRKWSASNCFWIRLGDTTPQDLVAELGAPDAIYRKNDQRMYIHRARAASSSRTRRPDPNDLRPGGAGSSGGGAGGAFNMGAIGDDLTDTDLSNTASDEDGDDDGDGDEDGDEAVEDDFAGGGTAGGAGGMTGECFWNYFYLGFDVLISTPTAASRLAPTVLKRQQAGEQHPADTPPEKLVCWSADRLVATKVILHGNVPGSYPFNRHRRCRWEIAYLGGTGTTAGGTTAAPAPVKPCNSETPWAETEERLREEWKPTYASEAEAKKQQRGMVLNRGWGDSPGSSIELLGGWEGDTGGAFGGGAGTSAAGASGGGGAAAGAGALGGKGKKVDGSENSTTTLYGFPGLVFEVLRNGFVSAVTVF